MKNQKKIIFLLIIILLLLAGSIYYFYSKSSSSSATGATVLLQKTPEDVASVSITNSSESYTVYQDKEKGVFVEGYEDLPLNQEALDDLFYYASYIRSQTSVETPSGDLETYGLSSPAAEVTVCFNDGQNISFKIGNQVPGQNSSDALYFLYQNNIYIAYKLHLAPFLYTKNQYLDQQITPVSLSADDPNITAETALTLTSLTMERQDLSSPVEINYSNSEDVMGYSLTQYQISFQWGTVYSYTTDDIGSEFLSSFFNLSASEIYALHPSTKDLESCGLDTPFFKAEVTCKDGNESVRTFSMIASQPSGGKFYIMNDTADIIYCSDNTDSLFFTVDPASLVSCYLLAPDINQLASVDILSNDTSSAFIIDHTEDTVSAVSLNGISLSVGAFKSFYQNLISLKGDSVYQDTTDPQAFPYYTSIDYHLSDDSTEELDFYSLSERELLAVVNNQQKFVINKTKLDNLWAQISELADILN